MPKDILIATIGTRDLAYHSSSGDWLNIGNDRKFSNGAISEAGLVIEDLATEPNAPEKLLQSLATLVDADYRFLTRYLFKHLDRYLDRLKPIIIGRLLEDKHQELKYVYLIGTDQRERVREREKDTLYAAEIIKEWIIHRYRIPAEVIPQGEFGENPSDFEQMFRWWKKKWQEIYENSREFSSILICLKGGVNQSSEAARITALVSEFAEKVRFYDFRLDQEKNRIGVPSPYLSPIRGISYLWDRRQKEALELLRCHDYQAVDRLLSSYYKIPEASTQLDVKKNLSAAIAWNQSRFEHFASRFKPALNLAENWWWTAYEAAYLGIIRLEQGNTVEAMFHTFRAVEGLMSEWAIATYPQHMEFRGMMEKPFLKTSITQDLAVSHLFERNRSLPLYGSTLDTIFQSANKNYSDDSDIIQFFDHVKEWRNQVFHRLIGLDKIDVFDAWGTENKERWSNRVLGCLNFISGKSFKSLQEASMMPENHEIIHDKISQYEPSP